MYRINLDLNYNFTVQNILANVTVLPRNLIRRIQHHIDVVIIHVIVTVHLGTVNTLEFMRDFNSQKARRRICSMHS